MSRIKYKPSTEIVDIVAQDILAHDNDGVGYVSAVVAATLENTLASMFALIARMEAAYEDHDSEYTLTRFGQFNEDVRHAIFTRIPLSTDHIDTFLRFLAYDLYDQSKDNVIGGKWGYIKCAEEISLVIEYRKPVVEEHPDWVKAELV